MTFPNIAWSPARMATRVLAPCVIALVLMLLPRVAHAGTITVNGTTCTLPEAITAANTDAAFNGCTAGSGVDTLLLGGLTHSLATGPYDHDGMNATPSVTSKIVISGGMGGAIVERSGVTEYRLFHVSAAGNLTLHHVTVQKGYNITGGGIINRGMLTLTGSNIISNTGGGISNGGVLTLTDSHFISNLATSTFAGGGMANSGTATLTNTHFISNTAYSGGGIYNSGGTLNVANSDFISNTADRLGGGIANNNSSTATLTDCEFIANTASDDVGGGFANTGGSTATLTDCNFISNKATFYGGGLYNGFFSIVTLTNTHFIFNSADRNSNTLEGGSGGGMANSGKAALINSEFIANSASDVGGGIFNSNDSIVTLILTNSDFVSNTAERGGGIYNHYSTMTATNTHFISNTAEYGGGIYNNNGTMTTANSEFIVNIAFTSGGGVYIEGGNATVATSRLLDNEAETSGGALQQIAGTTTIDQSCIMDNSDTAINHVGGDPIVAAHNWWGAPDGPGGAGPGGGDSVSVGVNFAPFLTSEPSYCLVVEGHSPQIFLPNVQR